MTRLAVGLLVLALEASAVALDARAQERPTVDLRTALEQAADRTGYRLLFRDALIEDVWISESATTFESINREIAAYGITLSIDDIRRVVVVLERGDRMGQPVLLLPGQVVDAASGAPLPFATITWDDASGLRGVAADRAGNFRVRLDFTDGPVELRISYIGYRTETFAVSRHDPPRELLVRLRPETARTSEVIVTGSHLRSSLDTTWHDLARPNLYAPFGESNIIRSMTLLPAMGIGPAASEGLIVRGSPADGLLVTLDGLTVYSHSHLFGLFDAFNADALQTAAFYYDVAPATIASGIGGIMAYETRRGSPVKPRASAGLTNTAARFTAETPLMLDRASLLVAGRRSHMDALSLPGNDPLIRSVLNHGRPSSDGIAGPVREGNLDARFYDFHAAISGDLHGNHRLTLFAYSGGNHASLDAGRRIDSGSAGPPTRIESESLHTWGATTVGVRTQMPVSQSTILFSTGGLSLYRSQFEREDFEFRRPIPLRDIESTRGAFANESELREWSFDQRMAYSRYNGPAITLGASVHRLDVEYREHTDIRPLYELHQEAIRVDGYGQIDWLAPAGTSIEAGLRAHYFSSGAYIGLSPRLRATVPVLGDLTLGGSMGRTHQFVHRVTLGNEGSPSFWILNRPDERPSTADLVSAGIFYRSGRNAAQVEGYVKRMGHLRNHEATSAGLRSSSQLAERPFITDLSAFSRGIETMLRSRQGRVMTTGTYALTRSEVWTSHVARTPAEWDRRHRGTISVSWDVTKESSLSATWIVASGAPNTLAVTDPAESARHPVYHRLDLAASLVPTRGLTITAAVFNAYDQHNVWYRDRTTTTTRPGIEPQTRNVNVFDLGIRPSIDLSLRF